MKKNKGKNAILIIIILLTIIAILLTYNLITSKNQNNTITEQNEIQTENNINPNLTTDLEELSQLEQYDRIKYYMDKYLFYIEEQDYEKAYSLLHDEFKQEHFKTIEEFTQYAINKYPIVNTIEYTDYNKLGTYHILTIKFSDILNSTENNIPTFEQKYIFVETGLNEYKMSFQAE